VGAAVSINLGYVPQKLTVTLVDGGDFVAALVASEAWPAGTGIELRLSGGTAGADWDVPYTDVRDVIDTKASSAQLVYTETDGSVLIWGEGSIRAV
jgi:hypothetical protein